MRSPCSARGMREASCTQTDAGDQNLGGQRQSARPRDQGSGVQPAGGVDRGRDPRPGSGCRLHSGRSSHRADDPPRRGHPHRGAPAAFAR
jgi:hypothetical protein